MPNRMLRPWINSDKINGLSVYAERFFTRLIMVVDDYGCFYADSRLLKANLFPLLLDSIREADLLRWVAECHKAGLIVLYESNNKQYLQIIDFRQRLDKARAKYPLPPKQNDSRESVNDFPAEVEVEVERNREGTAPSILNSNLFRQPNKPDLEKVKQVFYSNGGTMEMAEKFYRKHEATGWYLNNSPIENFSSLVYSFIENWRKFNPQESKKRVVI